MTNEQNPSPVDRGDGGVTIEQLDATAEMLRLGGVTLGGKFALEVVALARQALSAPAPAREDEKPLAVAVTWLAHYGQVGVGEKLIEYVRSLRSTIATLTERVEKAEGEARCDLEEMSPEHCGEIVARLIPATSPSMATSDSLSSESAVSDDSCPDCDGYGVRAVIIPCATCAKTINGT